MNTIESISLCALGLVSCNTAKQKVAINERLPNIIYIFADDLGYGDLSCFGATDIKTSNIDRIASEGIRFTEFYSAAPVCSPSRAALLTGRLPQRMGINEVFFPESFTGMPQSEITIAEMLKEKNYATGIVGKWHLGHQYKYLPLQQGFDSYFGIPYSNDMESVVYMRDNEVEEYNVDQKYITRRYTEEALKFIDQNKDNPFFLYVAHNMPHVPIYASEDFIGTSERGLYGDVVQELDWSVGQILERLEQLNLLENTLVIFSSDNGPWLVMEDMGGSAGILREGKQYTFEGGMRVPTVAMWKNKIPAGIIYNNIACQMDWLPTFAEIAGINLPEDLMIDGKDISQVLFNRGKREDSTYMYFDGADLQCYRKGNWKIKKPYEGYEGSSWKKAVKAHDTLLIDLKGDPGEKNNLFEEYPEKTRNLFKEMNNKYTELGELPPSLVVRSDADNSHYEYLEKKRNKNKRFIGN
jgi:arylsulfatase A